MENKHMARQLRVEGGDYPIDVTSFRGRAPEPSDLRDGDSHLAAAYAAQADHDLNTSQVDRAGKQKPYQNIEDVCDNPGKTSDPQTQHTMPDALPRRGKM